MKKINLITILIAATLIFMLESCKKSEATTDLTKNVTGTYLGTLETTGQKTTDPATANIQKLNDYSVSIHCIGNTFDTTFMMDLYENGDSMMLCFTDQDFEYEYHHQMTGGHHMMGSDNWQSWTNHMMENHTLNDEHYGSFSMTNHSFVYRFKTPGNNSQITKVFTGTKKNQ